jgi:hypothetical protein
MVEDQFQAILENCTESVKLGGSQEIVNSEW